MTDPRPQTDEALHQQREWVRATISSIGDAVITTDINGGVTFLNSVAQSLTGWTQEEAAGKPLDTVFKIVNEESRRTVENPATRALREGVVLGLANHSLLIAKNGTERPIDNSAAPIRNDNGDVYGVVLVFRDISERRRQEQHLQEQVQALADLHRRKDEFLAMLSHELRNPLAPISNAVQLLRLQPNQGEVQKQACAIIERQIGQLVHLVNDLLEVSRIATGRIHLHREKLDMRAVVECGVETVRPLIEQRRHLLAVHIPPSPIWIDGDSTRLEQVVVNLLNNAAKYTDERGHIRLRLEQAGMEAILHVRDSGVGIAPELMPGIFDLFTQVERSLARSQGGLGIGLCLVQRIVEMHGGKVEAYSSVGQGSEFVVRLPVVLTAEPHPPSPPTERAKPTGPSLRVLVVDDNVDAARSLEILLEGSGHDVRTAHDGPNALDAARDYRPNVVLLDVGLPGLDGYQVAKRMRQQPVLQNVVLVAMTGYGQDSDRQRAQEAGFDHHLVKPARFEEMQRILATVPQKAT